MSTGNVQRAAKGPRERGNKSPATQTHTSKNTQDGHKAPEVLVPKVVATPEQIRLAQIISDSGKTEDPELQEKIKQVMEVTSKSSDDVVIALHDCDNDTSRAINMLIEGIDQTGEWETTGKKKKAREPSNNKNSDTAVTANNKENRTRGERGRDRDGEHEGGRNRGPPRLNWGGGRNWRNKENEKNEKNLEDCRPDRNEGRQRGGRRGRGRGGNRSRTFQNRGYSNTDGFPQSIDTWTNSTAEQADMAGSGDATMTVGNWSEFSATEDWSEEDWTGSLTETKVFTPSTNNQALAASEITSSDQSGMDIINFLKSGSLTLESTTNQNSLSPPVSSQQPSQLPFNLSEYTQQATETIKAAVGVGSNLNNSSSTTPPTNSAYVSGYTNSSSSVALTDLTPSTVTTGKTHPVRTKTPRVRVPPPSKIPESAVEMPDDSIAALDVQFGGLEFGTDTFDFTTSEPTSVFSDSIISTSTASNHLASQSNAVPSVTSVSSNLTNKETFSIPNHPPGIPSPASSQSVVVKDAAQALTIAQSSLSQKVTGPEQILLQSQSERKSVSNISYNSQRPPAASLEANALSTTKGETVPMATYSASNHVSSTYSTPYASQKTALNSNLNATSNAYNHSSSLSALGSSHVSTTQTYPSGSSAYGIQQSVYSVAQTSAVSTYPSQTVSGYTSQNTSYQANAYTGSQQGYGPSAATTQASTLHSSAKLANSLSHSVKDSVLDSQQTNSQHTYENAHTTNTTNVLTSTLASTTTSMPAGLAATNITGTLGMGSSSTSTTSVLKNSMSATNFSAGKTMPNIPPGVPTAMLGHQYVMGNAAAVPFYGLQQPIYSYEDLPMVPSRIPALGYYADMPFQVPTSLTGRDLSLSSMAYADTKFSRGDSDTSQVATTLSQAQTSTQTHSQPFLNPAAAAALPPGYGYYFPSGMMPGSIHHYAAPPIFPVPPATNAHGTTTNTQFQKATAYGSHSFASGYESLTQTPDYTKGAYGAGSQGQGKGISGSLGSASAADIPGSLYSKTHAQLAKSFEKPGFHAGTPPPPFNVPGAQAPSAMGASSAPYPFIPVLAAQHHSTVLHHQLQHEGTQQAGAPTVGPQRGGPQVLAQQKGPGGNKQNFAYWNST